MTYQRPRPNGGDVNCRRRAGGWSVTATVEVFDKFTCHVILFKAAKPPASNADVVPSGRKSQDR